MIHLSSAGKRFGPKVLFEGLDWLITSKDRVGMVGRNGTGKSTLLKVLAGLESLDKGSINAAKGTTAGYLPQDGLALSGSSVLSECLSVFDDVLAMEREMEAQTHRMAELDHESAEYRQVAERFHHLEGQFRAHDGYAIEAQAGAVLAGLGFPTSDWHRPTEEFSGGWQMRVALAKLLLQKPNLLLLDEPTNHLDLEARNWLEQYLNDYPHAFVLVSHDRYFLDVTVDKTAEIWNRRVHFYPGNYDQYVKQKAERSDQLEAAYRHQQAKLQQLEAFINRFRYKASKAKQVQSRIKEIERMEKIELPAEEKTIHFSFPQPRASGRMVVEFRNVAKSYAEKRVFGGVNFTISRGDRIALVGVNGAGKSTLIRMLAGTEPLTEGEYRLGHNAEPDYFAQDQYKVLDPEARLLDDLSSISNRSQTELRSLLGCFLFSEDDAFKRIGVLSGGERNRYALARMLLRPSNFMLLDEPTNHLDLRAKDVLLEALQDYSGTVVFVSHDRYFIDKLATRVFEIESGEVRDYPGNYEDYLWQKAGKTADVGTPVPRGGVVQRGERGGVALPRPNEKYCRDAGEAHALPGGAETKPKRLNPIRLRQLEERGEELEAEIARCEAEIAECEAGLANFKCTDESIRLAKRLEVLRSNLPALLREWEEVALVIQDSGSRT